jgi:hypothetical protein
MGMIDGHSQIPAHASDRRFVFTDLAFEASKAVVQIAIERCECCKIVLNTA